MSEAPDGPADWRRWEAPTVGARREPKPAPTKSARAQSRPEKPGKARRSRSEKSAGPVTAAEIESIQEAAYQEAWEKGHEEGLKAGRSAARDKANHLEKVLDALAEPLAAVDEQVEQELSDLACLIARQIIRRELKTDPGQIVAVVREAVQALPSSERQVRVQLHPEDARLLRELIGSGRGDSRWELVEDPSISRGGCLVSDRNSRVDLRLEQQVGRVLAGMLGEERTLPDMGEFDSVEMTEEQPEQAEKPDMQSSSGEDDGDDAGESADDRSD
ncbi:flagellar assembly protein FliH [Gammaproteobacteria bacterium AB-CW1]|uniref:Flagellar assembly protein FliH n=1 Tax=Natronospira elongata TaxID=3110268 RepID=A0AAP6JDT4_9GAMM|nr:flagellar assembly protein FliH [Gammaproteobacteria bacterium AB-CW1]